MQTSVAPTTTVSSACLTCGTIKKSDKLSCCARGGSWFGKCGATGNTKLQHTWHEGIQACEAGQYKAVVMEQQQNSARQDINNSSGGVDNALKSKTSIKVNQTFASTPANMSTLGVTPVSVHNNATWTTTDTSMSNTVIAHTSARNHTGAMPTKVIATASATVTYTPVKASTQRRVISSAKMSIAIPVYGSVTDSVNSIVSEPDHVPLAEASTDIDSFYASASVSNMARECAALLGIVACISCLFISW